MHSAILYLLTGEPSTDELPSNFEGFPAADTNRTAYLDGRTIHHGRLAGRVEQETDRPVVGEDFITTEREAVTERVATDFYADLEAGWAGVTASAGEDVLVDYLADTAGMIPETARIDLQGFVDALPEDADAKGIVYSQSVEGGFERDRAGAKWHADADRGAIPSDGLSALSVAYTWDGKYVEGMLAASGYVAVYPDWTVDVFGRWIADVIEPHLEEDREDVSQEELA